MPQQRQLRYQRTHPHRVSTAGRAASEDAGEALTPVELTDSLEENGTCKLCGIKLDKAPWSCDRLGREVGGIGAIPGFGWWPIKAYRPCPAALKAGVKYVRKGQITDDVLFGRRKQKAQQ
ncbi:hypothetical protein WJX84_011291 [Apatococcus fuscideae]|uniref:Uncharacterized protein n=1 Tax=Apatococcus fuscideae TaxID=2026836 RepID=A0AAW1TEU5_9CHLO